MASGRQTLKEIERSIADLRAQEKAKQEALERATQRRMAVLDDRTKAYRDLAEQRAKAAVSDGVIDQADRLNARVASILTARQKTIDSLKARDRDAHAQRQSMQASAAALHDRIDSLEARLDTAARAARDRLGSDQAFQELEAVAGDLETTLKKAREKTTQAEADRKQKGQAYESDPLFMYLWRRRYGSRDYDAGPLTRMLDDWVAKLVRYSDARANYAILNEIPVRLKSHAEMLAGRLDDARAAVENRLAKTIAEMAGEDLTAALREARLEQTEVNRRLEAIEAEITDVSLQLNRYAEGLDDPFKEAVALSADFLRHESYLDLLTLARATLTPTDDEIVKRIGGLNREAAALETSIPEQRLELDRLARRRHELLDVAANFRRNHYDAENSYFEPDDIAEELLELLIKGGLTAAEYWVRSQNQHGWRWRSADPFRRSAGWPPFGGGGGRSRKSSRSGGRFRTGGGF